MRVIPELKQRAESRKQKADGLSASGHLFSLPSPLYLLLSALLCSCATTTNRSWKMEMPRLPSPLSPLPSPDLAVSGGYSITPGNASIGAAAGGGSISLTVPTWSAASSNPEWLSVSPASGSGDAVLSWSVTANPGDSRSGTISIADKIFTVTQSGSVISPTWAKGFGSPGTDYGAAVAYDSSGNVIVTGVFYEQFSFGGILLTNSGGADVFVAKLTAAGSPLWAKRFGGAEGEIVRAIALDATGNIFLAGDFVTGSLMKLSAQGDLLWSAGPVTYNGFNFGALCYAADVDSAGNIVISGGFQTPYDGSHALLFGAGISLDSYVGGTDGFVAKYSASGACLWAKGFRNGDTQYATGVAVDRRHGDTIALTGYAFSSLNLGGALLVNTSYGAFGFLGKFAPDGTHLWSRRVGTRLAGDNSAPYARAQRLAIDAAGNIVVAGEYRVHANFAGEPADGTDAVLNGPAVSYDMFLAKYSGAGKHLWSVPVTGTRQQSAGFIAIDSQSNVVVSGQFQGTINFGVQSLATAGFANTSDGFVAKYSSAGAPIWARRFGGTSDGDNGACVAVDAGGFPVVTGSFQGTAVFDGRSVNSNGAQDILLGRLNP